MRKALLIITLIITALPLLYDIGKKPVILWDESRNACNALEMYQNHQYLVRYYDGKPDDWEIKPPLLIWTQVLSFHLFGISEFTLRLPVILCLLALFFFIILFSWKYLDHIEYGIFACLIIVSSDGFIDRHIGRTGDHDGMLVLWLFLGFLLFYLYTQSEKGKYLILLSIVFSLAFLTKTVAGFVFLPAFILFTWYKKLLVPALKSKHLWLGIALFIGITGSYYLLRSQYSDGYFIKSFQEDFLGRFINNEGRYWKANWWYYLQNFTQGGRFVPWIFLLILVFPAFYMIREQKQKDLFILLIIIFVTTLAILSKSAKNLWYDAPLYPIMGLLISISVLVIIEKALAGIFNQTTNYVFQFLIILLLSIYPYSRIMEKLTMEVKTHQDIPEYSISFYLKEKIKKNEVPAELNISYLAYKWYNAHLRYYSMLSKIQNKQEIPFIKPHELKPGDLVIISENAIRDSITSNFDIEVREKYLYAEIIQVMRRK
jgi:4-amino-4-deoxy-L-arabinose transferase-like glycosyltransferase